MLQIKRKAHNVGQHWYFFNYHRCHNWIKVAVLILVYYENS